MNKKYQITKQSYNQNVDEYVKNTFHSSPPPLQDFIQSLPEGAKVVDLGCGPGRDSRDFIGARMDYLGIDFSDKTIKKAKELNPEAQFKSEDFMSLKFEDESVDAFWAIASLYHLNKEDFAVFVERLYEWLKPGGQFFVVMKGGEGEHFKADERYKTGKKFVSYYTKEELERIYKEAGFGFKDIFEVRKDEARKIAENRYENRDLVVSWLRK